MSWADEGKNHNGERKKPQLLPTGDNAKEIIELLAAMYRTAHDPEDVADNDHADNGQQANEDGRSPE